MAICSLSLTNFRNHAELHFDMSRPFVILHGQNGAGKTNILEALSLLVPGRGLRRATLGEMARSDGPGGFAIGAHIADAHIGVGTDPALPERRIVRVNGSTASANSLSEWLAIMWLTPAMDRLFMEGPGNRRRFLDRLVLAVDPEHAAVSSRYEQALRQRNRMLNDERPVDPRWMDAIEQEMAADAARINGARAGLVTRLSASLAGEQPGPFAVPRIGLDSVVEEDAAVIANILKQSRGRDRAAKRTLYGPHRTDLIVNHMATGQAAALCSTGEQKALLLSIIFAHAALVTAERGAAPVMLLDEVAAHLDPVRRAALYERLAISGCQTWMTGTEASLFEAVGAAGQFIEIGG